MISQMSSKCWYKKLSRWCTMHHLAMIEPPRETMPVRRPAVSWIWARRRPAGMGGVGEDSVGGGVDVPAGGKVHHVVGTPADGPHQLFDLLLDARSNGRVADVGVDLDP